jgi:hypothetical protein
MKKPPRSQFEQQILYRNANEAYPLRGSQPMFENADKDI